jgi:hypothetical protein
MHRRRRNCDRVVEKRRPRRTVTIDHVRVELHDAHIIEDRVADAVWRVAISMTNNTRRPRVLPVFAARATVTAKSRVYLAEVFLENESKEVNPGDVALAWVDFVLPENAAVRHIDLTRLRCEAQSQKYRLRCSSASTTPTRSGAYRGGRRVRTVS